MLHQAIFNTSQICHQFGVKYAVMSPGSRNAPLTVSFARNGNIRKFIIPDERTAGFIALGIAQMNKTPVVLCCTSGTALLNYAPAIAEAYYREIPLIVLSADRPPDLIDQRDGQTIRQFEALKNHVKASYQLPLTKSDEESEQYQHQLIEGLHLAQDLAKGPVHFNIPFEEPFYPEKGDELFFEEFKLERSIVSVSEKRIVDFETNKKVLVLVGQNDTDHDLSIFLDGIQHQIPILKSPLNNLQLDGIAHIDAFIGNQEELKPDILITSGLSVLSKNLKNFLRKNIPKKHYHFDPSGIEVDTYGSNPILIKSTLKEGLSNLDFSSLDHSYLNAWQSLNEKVKHVIDSYFQNATFSESSSFKIISESLPDNCQLHIGNSMPVRFADLFGIAKGITTWSNRGTSGIDGCSSTAAGSSLVSDELNVLFSGDVSFLYDRNAFFHNYRLPNLRIVIFNNHGGGIFRLIEGPANLPELESYFETRHNRTAKYICLENDIAYTKASSFDEINEALKTFYEPSNHCKILEVFTDPEVNQKEYKKLKRYLNEHINN